MKKISQELRYDGATLQQVHAMLADPKFREAVCDYQQVKRREVSIDEDGNTMSVTVDQVQAAQGIPSFAKKFVGDEINIVQSEEWTDPAKGKIQVVIPGKPGEMTGTALVTEDPDGVTETVNMSVKVAIPVVGGKIEGLIADLLGKALRAENKVGKDWLAGKRS